MKYKTALFYIILFDIITLSCGMKLFAFQEKINEERGTMRFAVDYARFRYSETQTFLEIYAAIYRSQLNYIPDGDRYRGEFITTINVFQKDSLIATKSWKNVNIADSLSEILEGQRLFCINDFVLDNGTYNLSIKIQDANNPSTAGEYTFSVSLPGFNEKELQISDIQLAGLIQRDTTNNFMVKNGFRIIPNPAGIYGIGMPVLYMYSEIYNFASPNSELGATYQTQYKIYDADGKLVKTMDAKIKNKPGRTAVEVSGINVVTLVSGIYNVVLEVIDRENNHSVTTSRRFFVYREADYAEGGAAFQKAAQPSSPSKGSPGLDADRYAIMQEKEIDQEFEYTRYISTKEERDTYKKLNLQGKRTFIKEFWAKRDQTPDTPDNEFKRDYLARVEYANQNFKGGFRSGWKSDRGRILLLYGNPDEIERFPFSNQNRTYEIWHYFSQQGGIHFYFVDKRETGEMELVHSTARGELYDPEWERWIDPNR